MAGHSKWKQIKRKKAVTDARRGASWTKVIREITVAARAGGGDPGATRACARRSTPPRRSTCPATTSSVPSRRAPVNSRGELRGSDLRGLRAGGAAVIIEATTDNTTRTVAEIRHAFSRNNGNLGATNSVAWMFDRKGQVYLDAARYDEDPTLEAALESGAEDFIRDGEQFVITTTVPAFHAVQDALRGKGFEIESAEIAMVPKTTVKIEGKQAEQMIRLVEALEELDDVSKVFSNFDIDASSWPRPPAEAQPAVRVLGVDPGTAATGYGVVEADGRGAPHLIECGVIRPTPGGHWPTAFGRYMRRSRPARAPRPRRPGGRGGVSWPERPHHAGPGTRRGVILLAGARQE